MTLETDPVVKTWLLIRRPAAQVYEAFVDPAITTKFWFSKGDRRLEPGGSARWDWEMYGAHALVRVKGLEPSRRILIDWGDEAEGYTEVEWRFEPRGEETLVHVENRGFPGAADEKVAAALDSIGGFSLVLAGAKVWLEHGVAPGFVVDKHPDALVDGWKR